MRTMYDALTARYTFACPRREQAQVSLSSFRLLERLPGAAHPAVYGIRFDCRCGEEHTGLVAHDDLDWAPLGAHAGAFVDLMTSRTADAADELLEAAASHLRAGEWPWTLLLLRRGPATAGLPVLVRRGRARRAAPRACRSLPRLRRALRQPRLAGARRPPVRERRARSASSTTSSPATRCARSRSSTPSSTPPASTSAGCT